MKEAELLAALSALAALIAFAALPGGQAGASSADGSAGNPVVLDRLSARDAWVAEPLPGQSMTTAYMIIANESEVDELLTSAESAVAENVEIHSMEQQGEMMRMRRVDSVEIAAGSEVELKPGGLHLMLIGLVQEVEAGGTVELKLSFESGAILVVSAPVIKR